MAVANTQAYSEVAAISAIRVNVQTPVAGIRPFSVHYESVMFYNTGQWAPLDSIIKYYRLYNYS